MAHTFFIIFSTLLVSTISIIDGEIVKSDDSSIPRDSVAQFTALVRAIKRILGSLGPLSLDYINADLPFVNCSYYNATQKGLDSGVVTGLLIDKEDSKIRYNLECQYIDFHAMHVLKGKIGNFSIEGQGPVWVHCDDYVLVFEGKYEKTIGKDNKEHFQIKSYMLDAIPRGRVKLDLQNINAGDKDKTAAFYQFVEENWEPLDRELRTPVLRAFMDIFIKKLNDSLSNISAEELLKTSP